jgi:RND family efflux transporter MFP subunit
MNKRRSIILIVVVLIVVGVVYFVTAGRTRSIVLTGIVTTDDVIVSSQIQGRMQELKVKEGDHVTKDELLAVIQPQEQEADADFYARSEQQTEAQVKQAEADMENAWLTYQRDEPLFKQQAVSEQDYDQARLAYEAAKSRVDSLKRQVEAAHAQKEKSLVQLSYTQIHAPVNGIVDTRAAMQGEVVNPGQAIVTLINEDDLWVRADVEESYIDRIFIGQKLQVTLPSGAVREGTVFYRGVDADFATQRDVSRTKRDIRTFEIRLRCDNQDRALAVGMTAYVDLPVAK